MFVRWHGVAKQRDPLTFDFKRVDFSDISFPLDVALLYKARIILIYSLPFSSRVAVIFVSQPAALTNSARNAPQHPPTSCSATLAAAAPPTNESGDDGRMAWYGAVW